MKNALRFLPSLAELFHLDMNNVFIAGDSSGAHIGLLTGPIEDLLGTDQVNHVTELARVLLVAPTYQKIEKDRQF